VFKCTRGSRSAVIRRITADLDPRVHLNTAISALMELVNELYAFGDRHGIRPTGRDDEPPAVIVRAGTAAVLREAIEALVLMLSPFTPHLCEELWEGLGHPDGVVAAGWPAFDEAAAREEEIEIPVQVNGKVRARITVAANLPEEDILTAARAAVTSHLPAPDGQMSWEAKVVSSRGRISLVSFFQKRIG